MREQHAANVVAQSSRLHDRTTIVDSANVHNYTPLVKRSTPFEALACSGKLAISDDVRCTHSTRKTERTQFSGLTLPSMGSRCVVPMVALPV